MSPGIGLDLGSTTAKVVALGPDASVVLRLCERHRGAPAAAARGLLEHARELLPGAPVAITGSAGVALASALGAIPVHEIGAFTDAVRALVPGARTVVELGGQDAKIVWLDATGGDAEMNDRCAAGTGATIDRIARRLGMTPEALRGLRLEGDARVAAKCGVFAETDVVNLVQRGVAPGLAIAALARAIVVQNLAVLARGRALRAPVVLLGGPHEHLPVLVQAWREALERHWAQHGIAPGEVVRPDHADTLAALGAAMHAAAGRRAQPRVHGVLGPTRVGPGLVPRDDERPRLTAPWTPGIRGMADGLWVGLDTGSTSTKAVLLGSGGSEPLAASYGISSGDPIADARARLAEVLGDSERPIAGLGVTGYGAEIVAEVLSADVKVLETLAHARGAAEAFPGVEVVVDVGGTDVKVLRLRHGRTIGFHLSSQCSAGHGAFLATAAAELGVPMADYAERALSASRSPEFSVGCAIFLDTDRITFQRDGFDAAEILAGLARALPRNVWEMVVGEAPARLGRSFLLTGGVHRNAAAALAHLRYLEDHVPGARVAVHPRPELCGAIGAALEARDRPGRRAASSRDLVAMRAQRVRVESGDGTRCDRCEVGCARALVHIESERGTRRTLVAGNACERGADVGHTGARSRSHAVDLLAEEARRLFVPMLPSPARRLARPRVIGIPRVMALYRCAPFLLHYLRAAGVPESHLVLSPTTSPRLFQQGARAANDPCFPAKLVPAHVDWLLRLSPRPIEVLLLPAFTHAAIPVRGVTDTASCPIVAGCGHAALASLRRDGDELAARGVRALTPSLCMTDRATLEAQLLAGLGELLELDAAANRVAVEHGLRAQATHAARLRARGEWVLARARAAGRAVAVILARPYHADPGVQHGVSTELAARGIPVLGIASLPLGEPALLDLSATMPGATNSGCAERVWAARRIARDPHLVAVDLSSFRCGQDASVQGIVDDVLGDDKPVLRLHDVDEHSPGITLGLRIATFADAVRRHEGTLARPARGLEVHA